MLILECSQGCCRR